jgi:hypothetical protein
MRNRELVVPWSIAPTKVGRIMVFDFRNLLSLSLFGRKEESIHEWTQFAFIGEKRACRGESKTEKSASTELCGLRGEKKCREKRGQKHGL